MIQLPTEMKYGRAGQGLPESVSIRDLFPQSLDPTKSLRTFRISWRHVWAMRPRASLPPFDTLAGTISQRRERCLILADDAEFRFQAHAGVSLNGLAHPLDEF